jgi:hypothetical protein
MPSSERDRAGLVRSRFWFSWKFLDCRNFCACSCLFCLPVAGDTGIYQHLSGRKQFEAKLHGDGFLYLAAMTCTVQDSIASGLRAVWGYPDVLLPAYTGFHWSTLCLQLEMPLWF